MLRYSLSRSQCSLVFADTPYNCEDAYQKSNRTKSSDDDGTYVIDPDGPGGVDPFEVEIFFTFQKCIYLFSLHVWRNIIFLRIFLVNRLLCTTSHNYMSVM